VARVPPQRPETAQNRLALGRAGWAGSAAIAPAAGGWDRRTGRPSRSGRRGGADTPARRSSGRLPWAVGANRRPRRHGRRTRRSSPGRSLRSSPTSPTPPAPSGHGRHERRRRRDRCSGPRSGAIGANSTRAHAARRGKARQRRSSVSSASASPRSSFQGVDHLRAQRPKHAPAEAVQHERQTQLRPSGGRPRAATEPQQEPTDHRAPSSTEAAKIRRCRARGSLHSIRQGHRLIAGQRSGMSGRSRGSSRWVDRAASGCRFGPRVWAGSASHRHRVLPHVLSCSGSLPGRSRHTPGGSGERTGAGSGGQWGLADGLDLFGFEDLRVFVGSGVGQVGLDVGDGDGLEASDRAELGVHVDLEDHAAVLLGEVDAAEG
jgi:hypothetical protein